MQELETSSKISIQFNYENQTKKKKGEQRIFSFIGVGFLTVSCLISIRYDSHDLAFIPTQKAQKHLQRHHCMQRTGPF